MTVVTQSVITTVLSLLHLIDVLVCKIYHFLCYEAQLTECCGHVYYQSCVKKVKTAVADREYSFPICRRANFKTIAHHEANRAIKELLIYCPNNKEGWGKRSWTGALGGLNRHLKDSKVECRRCVLSLGYHAMRRHLTTLRSSVAVWCKPQQMWTRYPQ